MHYSPLFPGRSSSHATVILVELCREFAGSS
ncbi:hypothetical protein M6B38_240530 [Iris pallida]|uniref:Uncharacterized protein n=1 Tax=Iris pallida TaxID=29817 RepID=A0AAX6DKD2_IRIPA|nr:hypothetical protein M6B38_240530 [Iris pallida]